MGDSYPAAVSDGMIETVPRRLQIIARARYLSDRPRTAGHVVWDFLSEDDRQDYRLAARSLIEAMRIPTGAMKAKGNEIAPGSILAWQAIIDEALCES